MKQARWTQDGDRGKMLYPLVALDERAAAALELDFRLTEHAAAKAAGHREVLLTAVGGALLLLIGAELRDMARGRLPRRAPVALRAARRVGQARDGAALAPPRRGRRPRRVRRRARRHRALAPGADRRPRLRGPAHGRAQPPRPPRRAARHARVRPRPGHEGRVVEIDIDHFESLNDRRGHAAGDEALRIVSRADRRRAAPRRRLRPHRRRRVPARAPRLRRLGRGARDRAPAPRDRRGAARPRARRGWPSAPASPSSPATPATSTA